MTTEQLAEQYAIQELKGIIFPDYDTEKQIRDMLSKAYLAGAKDKWVKVEDGLPEKGQPVLVYGYVNSELGDKSKNMSIGLCTWEHVGYCQCPDSCYYDVWYEGVTHWMPSPTSPQD